MQQSIYNLQLRMLGLLGTLNVSKTQNQPWAFSVENIDGIYEYSIDYVNTLKTVEQN